MSLWVTGVTLGPIAGPALGGWLTDDYNWRWVFYINVPFGILAFIGTLATMPESRIKRAPFDFLGFATLSLAVGALQITLDRGQLKDWFHAPEIWIEAAIFSVCLYLFVVHMLTSRKTRFLDPDLFKNANFLIGCAFMSTMGLVLFATLALLPPLLQNLMNYPVMTTGLATAPRGLGTLLAMLVVSRLIKVVEARWIVAIGLAMTAFSAWQMTRFNLQMDMTTVVLSGLAQGVGTGMVYVPLANAAFATLRPALRNEGAAFFSLSRNLGSSIGISIVETMLTRNTQIAHATLAEHVSPFSAVMRAQMPAGVPGVRELSALNGLVTQQATMIAYLDDFKLMLWLCLAAIPMVVFLRKGGTRKGESNAPASIAVE
jgi:DHA2 family multidrug resistance protein